MTTPAPALAPAPGWPLLTRAAAPLWCTAPAASAAIAPDARTSAASCCASPRTFGKWAGRHGLVASLCDGCFPPSWAAAHTRGQGPSALGLGRRG